MFFVVWKEFAETKSQCAGVIWFVLKIQDMFQFMFFNYSTFNRISESFEVLHYVSFLLLLFSCAVLIICMYVCVTLCRSQFYRHDFSMENELSNICSCSCWMSFHIIQAKWIESVDVRMSLTYAINVFTMCVCTNLYLISNYLLNWLKI